MVPIPVGDRARLHGLLAKKRKEHGYLIYGTVVHRRGTGLSTSAVVLLYNVVCATRTLLKATLVEIILIFVFFVVMRQTVLGDIHQRSNVQLPIPLARLCVSDDGI